MRALLLWLLFLSAWSLPGAVLARPRSADDAVALRAELASAEQPARRVPTTGYTLALSWAPEYCQGARGARARDPECSGRSATGFTLHGLWPDGDGPDRWPQYCHPVALLTPAQVAAGRGVTPSPQLLQHEWARHGSCMGDDPVRYFTEEARLYRGIAIPDMAALAARRGATAADIQRAFARANPGLGPTMLRVDVNRRGWLEEVWICLGRDRRPRPCAAGQGGAAPAAAVRIEPGGAAYRGNGRGHGGTPDRRRSYGNASGGAGRHGDER